MAKPNIQIKRDFDPTTLTLNEFINLYMVEGREQGRELKNWGSEFKNIKAIAPYLDRPVIDVISEEFYAGKDSPLQQANRDGAATTLGNINAKFGAIYENVQRQVTALDAATQASLPNIKNLRGSFEKKIDAKTVGKAKDTKVAEAKFDYRFNPLKMGEFYAAVATHIKDNPQDGPALRAFLFNLQVGMRPNEVLSLTDSNVYQPRTSTQVIEDSRGTSRTWLADLIEQGSGNPFLTGYIPKTKTLVDAPLTNHALSIIGAQQQFNAQLEAKYPDQKGQMILRAGDIVLGRTIFMKDTPDGPKPVTSGDITEVLKKIKVPGIIEYIRPDGVAVPGDTLQESYDARRLNATIHKFIKTPLTVAAQLKGRGVTEQGAGREGDYRRLAFGLYPDDHIAAQNRLSEFFIGLSENLFYGAQYEGTPAYRQPLGQNFVPTELKIDSETGFFIVPAPDEKGPPVQLLDSSQGSRALSPQFQQNVNSATPDIEVVTDADYDAVFDNAKDVTPGKTTVPEVKIDPTSEEDKQSIRDRLQAAKNQRLGKLGIVGVVGTFGALSYSEGSQAVEEAGGGELAQKVGGVGKVLYDVFETTKMMGAGMALTSPEVQAPTGMGPVTDNPVSRAAAVAYNDKKQASIQEQQRRIQQYDAEMAKRNTLEDQMNQLQGIKPDIDITYPQGETP